MKKRLLPAILLAIMCVLSACNKAEPAAAETTTAAAATTTAATTQAATTAAETTVAEETTEEVTEDETADVPFPEVTYLNYSDIEMVEVLELSSWGDTSMPGMIEMNEAIQESVISRIESFEEAYEATEDKDNFAGGLDVWAYSISDENYIQIFYTVLEYPTYGTAGDLFGFIYDIHNDDYVTLNEYLELSGMTNESVAEGLKELCLEDRPTDTVDDVNLKSFYLARDTGGSYFTSFLFEMEVTSEEADEPYKGFFIYSGIDEAVWMLNSEQLFDPSSVDQYEEPLHCQEGWAEYYAEYLD
jgi:predicted small secreted protein